MAGILRPSSDLLQSDREAGYIIHGYNMYDPAENLFNGGMTKVSSAPFKGTPARVNFAIAYWYGMNSYLDIEFLNDVKIWDAGSEYASHVAPLDIYSNENGVKGSFVSKLKGYAKTYNATNPNWEEVATLKKGRYKIESTNNVLRISNEWYLENIEKPNKTLIYHDGEYKKWIGKTPGESEKVTSIPVMTSNTTPSGIASSSSVFSNDSRYMPFRAFNGVINDSNDCWYSNDPSDQWIAYEFTSSIVINRYSISSGNSVLSIMPKNFTFEGFDGSNWTVLDSRENVTNWVSMEYSVFPIRNNTPFIKYRLNIKNNNGHGSYLGIADFKMFKSAMDYQDSEGWMNTSLSDINSNGMDSLSPLLDRKVTTLDPLPMVDKSDISLSRGEGKMFSKTLDLKKYVDIRSMKVEVK